MRPLIALVVMLAPWSLFFHTSSSALGQQRSQRQVYFPVAIQWSRQKGVNTYRLQIATDETFRNIYYDGRVTGDRYKVSGIPPGYYYWRISPAASRTSEFSKPVRFFVSGGVVSARPSGTPARRPRSPALPASIVR